MALLMEGKPYRALTKTETVRILEKKPPAKKRTAAKKKAKKLATSG